MTSHRTAPGTAAENARGALLMVVAMLAFAFEDLFLKRAATALSAGQVMAMMGAAGATLFWGLALYRGDPILSRHAFHPAALTRSLSEAVASVFYLIALTLIPLSMNAALLQASPLAVTFGAAIFLREPVGWRRWTAITLGFVGVLVILRPGTDGFTPAGLLTVFCVLVLTARDLSTRVMPATISTLQLATWAYLALIPTGLVLMWAQGTPAQAVSPRYWGDLSGAVLTGIFGYYAVTAAMRKGDVSVVAPFRYVRLVFVVILAMVFLSETPDTATLAGSALIIGSGLYSFWRETVRRKRR